jgi:DNA-binding response OmpR family regulator
VRFRNALIIDSDAEASRKMTFILEKIFSNIYAPLDPDNFIRDVEALTPDAVFVNLGLKQRDRSFDFLEKMLQLAYPKPVIYGYAEKVDQELWGAAIDNGVQEIFNAPFDPSEITQKIKDLETNDQLFGKNLVYVNLPEPLPAKIKFDLEILEIDETGFTFSGNHYISKGASFAMRSNLVKEIFGQSSIEMMVTKTGKGPDGLSYRIYAEPRESIEQSMASLRKYVLSKIS